MDEPLATPIVPEFNPQAIVPPVMNEGPWMPNYAGPSKVLAGFNSDISNIVSKKSATVADNFHKAKNQDKKPSVT